MIFLIEIAFFRDKEKGRYCILNITLRLNKAEPKPPYYASLQKYIDENDIREVNLSVIRVAVLNIRSEKIARPSGIAKCRFFLQKRAG